MGRSFSFSSSSWTVSSASGSVLEYRQGSELPSITDVAKPSLNAVDFIWRF